MLRFFRSLWNHRAYALRGIFCWLVGLGFLLADYAGDFDFRFSSRPPQKIDSRILMLTIEPGDWGANRPWARQEAIEQTDSVLWREDGWHKLLKRVLHAEPAGVGVSFYFGSVPLVPTESSGSQVFLDPRVVWAARVDSEGKALLPSLARPYGLNTGVVDYMVGPDGIVRRLSSPLVHIPPLSARIVERALHKEAPLPFGYSLLINFRGGRGHFPTIRFKDLMEGKISPAHLKDKIVIIGSESLPSHKVLTPVGFMTRAELVATTVDNILENRWLRRFGLEAYGAYLFAILLLTIWIILAYPQSVSTIFLGAVAVLLTALSIWVFDAFDFWIPISAPIIQIAVTFIVFLSFQLSLNEQKAWKLEQEQRYLIEVEQLKSNFLSLFSHDLKTPIAKIQAIVDRVLMAAAEPGFVQDLKSLKKSSQELHRYIHSILQLSRVEAREMKIRKEAVDINELIEKAIEQILPLANEKKIRIEKNLEPMFSLELDPTLVGEVILNLVDNAVKFTPSGGVVKVSSTEEQDQVVIKVADNGIGMENDDLDKIWEKFYRSQNQVIDAKGSGLGLYLVQYFIRLHKGDVFVRSQKGSGTEIGFTLPISLIEENLENAQA
jgi:two-component system, OmpR family, phosphate regulon sensor histidine kinase PhoR